MIKNLQFDFQLRGFTFEHVAKILLRRTQKNNFIFVINQFDSHNEIVSKYRLKTNSHAVKKKLQFMDKLKWRGDLIEFKLDNVQNRNIIDVTIYEVKTMTHTVKRNYYEICKSNHKFYVSFQNEFGLNSIKLISMLIFENWRFSFNVKNYNPNLVRVFSHAKTT